ncbi:sel1 repeat family protein [Aliarcobacter cryaerophilus]|uniref:tetratricopeptide repeat protein n=1 Tax=Aliarcobacter cryaerophilus TaxID=28198 RepID=UPI0021B6A183|nr:tetratricopeptide repeat protein [Aliarcobacter cryaerophilus]MCT7465982.1 sel1 repeat family protein [Aliarcobacter cryaerophilus]
MRNYILLPIFTIFLFSACSFKMPEFLTFSDINYDELLKEANACQDLDTQKEKLDCYKKIENSNSFAQIRLGTYYSTKNDYKESLKYLNMADENKNLYAKLPLALLYYKGEGVKKDINKSFELLKESSDIDPIAAFQLSRFYLQGINTKIDNEKGIDLLEFSAQNGVLQAQELLSNVYKQGLYGVAKDQIKYEYWLNKATSNKEDKNSNIYIF